jgi:RNA polymerase sigma-70 factor, ECF subfamily
VELTEREMRWARWMQQAMAGDESAYRLLLESLASQLRSTVRQRFARFGSGDGDVEDVVQETLLAIHLKRHTWRVAEPIGPWVHAICRNKLVDTLRRRGRRQELPFDEELDAMESVPADEPDIGTSRDVAVLMDGLNDRQRDIVRMVSIEGHSARSAAGKLGMSEGAVRVALHRSLRLLAQKLRRVE